jgi:hypothetical protein
MAISSTPAHNAFREEWIAGRKLKSIEVSKWIRLIEATTTRAKVLITPAARLNRRIAFALQGMLIF